MTIDVGISYWATKKEDTFYIEETNIIIIIKRQITLNGDYGLKKIANKTVKQNKEAYFHDKNVFNI